MLSKNFSLMRGTILLKLNKFDPDDSWLFQRKVHARTGCDACSDCASGTNNARDAGAHYGGRRPKA